MRILHVVAGMDPKLGGVCQGVRSMIVGLSDLGINNEVVSLDSPDLNFLDDKSFTIQALGPGKGPWCYSSELIPWLVGNFSRFDGIIVHGLWLFTGYAVKSALNKYIKQRSVLASVEAGLPKLFVMPHGMLDPYFQRAPGRKLKALRNWIYWKIVEARIINKADKILFTSKEECELAKQTFSSYKPRKEVVIGLGVDEPPRYSNKFKEAFKRICPEIADSSYILFLGRIHEKKGLDMLVSAYVNILKKLERGITEKRNIDLPKLVIAGPGRETSYGKLIQDIIKQSPILSRTVFFTDMLTGDSKWGAFYGCEAFVLTSHQENFGIAVVEAMACQKPVLISDRVNIWREIEVADSGIIANASLSGTEQLLKNWLQLSKERKLEMGQNARKLYLEFFSVESVAKQSAIALL